MKLELNVKGKLDRPANTQKVPNNRLDNDADCLTFSHSNARIPK